MSEALTGATIDDLVARLKREDVKFKDEMIRSHLCRMSIILDSEGNSIIMHALRSVPHRPVTPACGDGGPADVLGRVREFVYAASGPW